MITDSLPLRLMESARYLRTVRAWNRSADEHDQAAELLEEAAANVVRDRIRASFDAPDSY